MNERNEARHRIGILGGTFNPIHVGHLLMAESAFDKYNLDNVLIMPTNNPPHKLLPSILDIVNRVKMIKLAIADNKHLSFSDFELKRSGVIFTSDTLELLKKENPANDYYLIIGADSLYDIEKWHEPDKIFKLAKIIVADRYDAKTAGQLKDVIEAYKFKYNAKISILPMPLIDISSSDIRKRIQSSKSIKYMVHPDVENHIYSYSLYKKSKKD